MYFFHIPRGVLENWGSFEGGMPIFVHPGPPFMQISPPKHYLVIYTSWLSVRAIAKIFEAFL